MKCLLEKRLGKGRMVAIWMLALLALVGLHGGARGEATSHATELAEAETHILVIENPKLWQSPSRKAKHAETAWSAGRRIGVMETRTSGTTQWMHVRLGQREGWLPGAFLAPPPPAINPIALDVIGDEIVDRLHGLPPEYEPTDLVEVGPALEQDKDLRMRREAAAALKELIAAARADGITLYVVSAFRPWAYQRIRYQYKLENAGWDQQLVAMPGHSEHQLGTTLDLSDGDAKTLLRESFGATAAGEWLRRRAPEFGFAISYTRHNREQTGYAAEPWHYRYWGRERAPGKHAAALGE